MVAAFSQPAQRQRLYAAGRESRGQRGPRCGTAAEASRTAAWSDGGTVAVNWTV